MQMSPPAPLSNHANQRSVSGGLPLLPGAHGSPAKHFARGTTIIEQGRPSPYCFQLLTGCARAVRLLEDGRRQIGEFLLPGDMIGLDPVSEQIFTIEAVTSVSVLRYTVDAIERRADEDTGFARALRHYTGRRLQASWERQVSLGRQTASERLLGFLAEMHQRLEIGDHGSMTLPMSRSDIADYLGLTIETVCRTLTDFRKRGLITVSKSDVTLRFRPSSTRQDSISAALHVH